MNIIVISSQLETLRYSLDSIWRWRWQQWWWWEWGWDKDDISEWRCCTCKLSASQGASCLSNMSAMKMSKRNIQFASWLEVVSICHLANLTAPQYDFRFLYMSFLTGHMCIALAKSKSHTLHHLNHFLRAVDSLRRKGSPYSRDRIPAHALDCIPIQHSAAASPFWGPAVHQSTALIPLGQWDIRMFLLVVARERRSTKPIHKRMFEFGLFHLGWCAEWYALQNMRFLEKRKDPCNYVEYIVDKWINQVTHFHPCRINYCLSFLVVTKMCLYLTAMTWWNLQFPLPTGKGAAQVHCATSHGAHPAKSTEATLEIWFSSWHVDVKDLTTTP